MTKEPQAVRLTEDYLDFRIGLGYPEGTILIRQSTGQYATAETTLGQWCVSHFDLIADISEPIE